MHFQRHVVTTKKRGREESLLLPLNGEEIWICYGHTPTEEKIKKPIICPFSTEFVGGMTHGFLNDSVGERQRKLF